MIPYMDELGAQKQIIDSFTQDGGNIGAT